MRRCCNGRQECVINALYHRSYEQREPAEVRVSPEELHPEARAVSAAVAKSVGTSAPSRR